MRIAYVATMKRGLAAFVYREIEQLTRAGDEVAVFTLKYQPGLYMPHPDWPLVRLQPAAVLARQPLHALRAPRRYARLARVALRTRSLVDFLIGCDYAARMRRLGIQAVHCVEGLHALAIGYYCHALAGLPLTATIHADALYLEREWPLMRTALQACSAVTTVCEFNRRLLVEQFGLRPERVHVVRLFVDAERFRPPHGVRVLIVGQFSQRKGHETLLRALRLLADRDVHVWVVGAGTWGSVGDFVDVPRLARDLGVAGRVTFFGSVSEDVLRVLYQACDIFCLPSRHYVVNEGLPVALMEAMASGQPVVSTRHAGIPELVPDVLVDENDVEGLAEALAYLADHPEVRAAMGRRNREIVLREYAAHNVDRMRDLFAAALAPSPAVPQEACDESVGDGRSGVHRLVAGR